jgi:hypothetical protein
MTTCVQKLDDSSVASCPLPWCSLSCEGALKRRFHLQDVHCAEFNKGIKRDRHNAAAEDEGPSITYRAKRRCVHQGSPDAENALFATMEYHFIDERVETIKITVFEPGRSRENSRSEEQPRVDESTGLHHSRSWSSVKSLQPACPPVTQKIYHRLQPPPTSVLNPLITSLIWVYCRRTI